MVQILVANYYELFDKKLENGTIIVLIISLCILFAWAFIPHSSSYGKADIFQASSQTKNIITIEGKQYEVVFKEL